MSHNWYTNAPQLSPAKNADAVNWDQKGGGTVYNNQFNPWGQNQPMMQPRRGVLTVANEGSIDRLQMAPNEEVLALHEQENLLYYIRADGVGAKSVARFRIFPEPTEEEKTANQMQQIMEQLQVMADRMTKMEDQVNAKSNYADDDGRGRKRRAERPDADGQNDA